MSEDAADHGWGKRSSVVGEGFGDVIDGEVLFAQGEDLVVEGLGAGLAGAGRRRREEVEGRVLAEFGAEDVKGSGDVAELSSDLRDGDAIDEASAQGFVLAVFRGCGSEEEVSGVCYLHTCIYTHIFTMST
jgi:hypothetical protein